MKTITKLALAGALGIALAGNTVWAQIPHVNPPPPAGPPAPPHAPDIGPLFDALTQKYDANQDGQLDAAELTALRQGPEVREFARPPKVRVPHRPAPPHASATSPEMLEKYDLNQDGKLDKSEREALAKDTGAENGPGLRMKHRSGPTPSQLLQKFDTNQDGKLDETETGALLDGMKQHRRAPVSHRAAPPTGGEISHQQ